MSPLLHLLKKDARHLWGWIGLTLATWSLLFLQPVLGLATPNQVFLLLLLVNGAGWLILFLTLAQLIHLDPLIGSDQFLAVRPVSRKALIGSKFLFIGLFLILPLLVIRIFYIGSLSLGLNWSDVLLLIPGLSFPLAAICLFALLPTLVTRRTASALLCFIGIMVALFFAVIFLGHLTFGARNHWIQQELKYLFISRYYVGLCIYIVCVVWGAAGFAITRRWKQPALAAAGFLMLSFAAVRYWPLSFVSTLHEKGFTVPVADQPNLSSLQLVPTKEINNGGSCTNGGTENGVRINTVSAAYKVTNLPKPWFARQLSFNSTARYANGSTLKSQQIPFVFWGRSDPLMSASVELLGLVTPSKSQASGLQGIDIFRGLADEMDQAKAASSLKAVDGEATFAIARPKILGTLPLKTGASLAVRHTRYTLAAVTQSSGRINIKIATESARIPFRGEVGAETGRNTVFLVADPATKTYYPFTEQNSSSFNGAGVYSIEEKSFSVETVTAPASLRLYLIAAENAREVSLPFQIPGKDIR